MHFPCKRFLMKNGEMCVLRSPGFRDAAQRIAFLRKVNGETDFTVRDADDSPADLRLVEDMLEDQLLDDLALEIAAFQGEEMIACGSIGPVSRAYPRTLHRAKFGICVARDFWSQGLGSAILDALVAEAPGMGYSQIELSVAAANERAQRLDRRLGFVETGRIPYAVRYEDGSFGDEIQMVRML